MIKKILVTVIALIAVVALGMKGKGLLMTRKAEVADEPKPKNEQLLVQTVEAKEGTLQNRTPYLAQLLAQKSITLSTTRAGYIEKILVEESQAVKKGDLLVRIDTTDLRSSIEGLKATLASQQHDVALAESIYKRNQKLFKVGGLSREQLDVSRVALEGKRAAVENTRQKIAQLTHQLSYLNITAPFDGTIDKLILHEGDLAATGKPILSMSSQKRKLVFAFAPSQAQSVLEGSKVLLQGRPIGKIKTIYNTSQNGLIAAEVAVDEPIALPVGSSITIDVVTREAKGCILPDNTIVHKKSGDYVMLLYKGAFHPYKVRVVMQEGDRQMVTPCPEGKVAQASEVKLSALPARNAVTTTGAEGE
jgi:RND family efflux transporter MFP subunit